MLRSIVPILVVSLCTMASAETEPAATPEEPVRETSSETPADQKDQGKTISSVEAGTGNFRYKVKFKRLAAEREGVECSYGRKTGSHKRKTYCRSDTVAKAESDAAREFFLAAMRNKN